MAIDHRIVQFRALEPDELIEAIDEIRTRGGENEWVTISPWVDAENLPTVSVLRRLVSSRGPEVPQVTWVPGPDGTAEIGVLHAAGPNAADRLRDRGVVIPDGADLVQDHTKRGLVFETVALDGRAVVQFAMAIATALAQIETDDRWVSRVSQG